MQFDFIDVLKACPDYVGSYGRKEQDISNAEKELNTIFAADYHCYLERIGLASFNGHELTGITSNGRLSVVQATRQELLLQPDIPASWYVIEQVTIDGLVVWQCPSGKIYLSAPGHPARKIYDSFEAFIKVEAKQ